MALAVVLACGRSGADSDPLADRAYPIEAVPDVPAAMAIAGGWLRDELRITPMAVGHRVVHGGPDYDRPVLIDHGVVARLERFVALAPLHQPHNLAPIRSLLANFPTLPQVACFDTAFHRTHDAVADYYAIPYQLHAEGVRRYGFHGLSYEIRREDVAPRSRPRSQRGGSLSLISVAAPRCAREGRTQRREHNGLHRARRITDGDAPGPNRSGRRSLSAVGKGNVGLRSARTSCTAIAD